MHPNGRNAARLTHNHRSTRALRRDARAFLKQYPAPLIIDEAQRVPDLFSYIQTAVDNSGKMGQYVFVVKRIAPYYRNFGNEVDLLLEQEGGITLVEVKSGKPTKMSGNAACTRWNDT